jgi:hypothetical protein
VSAIADGFSHSDIFGSKVARHLPEAYRRQATSFITFLESRHPPYALKFPIRKLKNHLPAIAALQALAGGLTFSILLNEINFI